MNTGDRIERYSEHDRINHWVVALLFLMAGASGLALFHPALFFLSNLFGGGPWTRILHPYLGFAMVLAFAWMVPRFWSRNLMHANDWQWMRQIGDVINNREDRLPPVGKYNAGQKLMFWTLVATLPLLLVTGVVFWRPWFAVWFPIPLIRVAALLHAAAASVLILGIVVHVYAAFWVKHTFEAMLRGTVSHQWARRHHLLWFREVTKSPPR